MGNGCDEGGLRGDMARWTVMTVDPPSCSSPMSLDVNCCDSQVNLRMFPFGCARVCLSLGGPGCKAGKRSKNGCSRQ